MLNNLYLIVGKSGSGKSTVVQKLCNMYNLSEVISYTTRPKRNNEKNGDTHIFVSQKEFDKIKNDLCAYTKFNGFEYGATNQMVNQNNFYVIDKKGIEYFKSHYNNHKSFKIIYIDVPEHECRIRMIKRGDSKSDVEKRIQNDRIEFAGIEKIVDITISNDYQFSCVCDIWEYILKCEKKCGENNK